MRESGREGEGQLADDEDEGRLSTSLAGFWLFQALQETLAARPVLFWPLHDLGRASCRL